jgi:hypothetical protein
VFDVGLNAAEVCILPILSKDASGPYPTFVLSAANGCYQKRAKNLQLLLGF